MAEEKTKAQQSSSNKRNLPETIELILRADFGAETNLQIARDFELTIGQLAEMTILVGKIFKKESSVVNLEKEVQGLLQLDEVKAKKVALEICGKRLLVCDKDWFGGEVEKKITALGGSPENYQDFVKQYLTAVEEEKLAAKLVLEDEKRAEEEKQREMIEAEQKKAEAFLKDPEAEKRSAKTVFANYLKDILSSSNYHLKIELNVRLITLLLQDEKDKIFQKELLDVMYENKEGLSKDKILLGTEKAEPTIGNWLRDYVSFVRIEEVASAIKRARYFTETANVKTLNPDEKRLLEDLLKLFTAVKNFYENASKMDLADIYIFPFSDEEQQAFLKEVEESAESAAEKSVGVAPDYEKTLGEAEAIDIVGLYRDKPADREKIDAEKAKIKQATRQEYDKIADWLENAIRLRKKHLTLACLELLVEIGALDNIIAADKRYQELLLGYYKRNGLAERAGAFKNDPNNVKYVQDFLKFIYLERLGMSENEGARVAANMSELFQLKGMAEYGGMAYLDLADNKFKWAEISL